MTEQLNWDGMVWRMLETLVAQRNETYAGFAADGGRETKGVLWTARRSNQSILKEISPGIHQKEWCWSWNSNTLATWCKELTCLKRPWCWERLRAGGEGATEDGMVEWHHWLNGPGFGWPPGVDDGQGGLMCCSSWGHKGLDTTERLNWAEVV